MWIIKALFSGSRFILHVSTGICGLYGYVCMCNNGRYFFKSFWWCFVSFTVLAFSGDFLVIFNIVFFSCFQWLWVHVYSE